MAKKRASSKKQVPITFKRVHGVVVEHGEGKYSITCPECTQEPIIKTVDYDCTSDSKYVWFTYTCPRCNLHIVTFSHIGGGKAEVSHLYDVYGRNLQDKEDKKAEKVLIANTKVAKKFLPKKLGKRPKLILPDLD